MCTIIILYRPQHHWPIIVGANRDEMISRSWETPGRHWEERPQIMAGLDNLQGGTWLGMNNSGLVAGLLNGLHSLGPSEEKRSRGELVLKALEYSTAKEASESLANNTDNCYRPFNMIITDSKKAYWLDSNDRGIITLHVVPPGISFFTAYGRNSEKSPKSRLYLKQFEKVPVPLPSENRWEDWEHLLASTTFKTSSNSENGAMCVSTSWGFGTVNSSLIALPSGLSNIKPPIWRFSAGPPNKYKFIPLKI